MLDREQAIRAAISAQGHLRTELKAPSNVWGDVARAERAVDAYSARPVAVTDEMVDQYWWAMTRAENLAGRSMGVNKATVRAVLEAALNPQQ